MAFPVVQATNESSVNTAGTSHAVNLPSGIQSGDFLVVLIDKGSTAATFNALAGWTELLDENLANGIAILYRWADGTEGASITLTSSASTRSAHISARISGAHPTTAPTLGTVGTGTSVSPNPGNCNPGVARDFLWIAMFGGAGEEADDDTWCNSAPTNFTGLLQKACGTVGTNLGGKIAAAQYTLNATSLDAGAFDQDVSTAWRAYTIAVYPSPYVTGAGAAAGIAATVAAIGASFFIASASGAGVGAGAGVGTGITASVAQCAAVGAAEATGQTILVLPGVGDSAGTGAALGTGAATFSAAGAGDGTGAASGTGGSTNASGGSAAGVADASGTGAGTAAGVSSAAGEATANGTGASILAALAAASGTADGLGTGAATVAGVGASAGTSTADGNSQTGGTTNEGAALAGCSSTALGTGAAFMTGAGAGAGTATATAGGSSIAAGLAEAAGAGSSAAVSEIPADTTVTVTAYISELYECETVIGFDPNLSSVMSETIEVSVTIS